MATRKVLSVGAILEASPDFDPSDQGGRVVFTTLRKSSEVCVGPSATNSANWQIIPGGRAAAKERRNVRANRGEFSRQPWYELELARELQSAKLPVCHPPEAAWDLAVRTTAAQKLAAISTISSAIREKPPVLRP
jgi:hypothetical protein